MNNQIFRKIPKGIELAIVLVLLAAVGYGVWFLPIDRLVCRLNFFNGSPKGERRSAKKSLN